MPSFGANDAAPVWGNGGCLAAPDRVDDVGEEVRALLCQPLEQRSRRVVGTHRE